MGLTGLSVKLADILPTITLFLSGNLYTLGDSAKRPAIRPFSFESVRLLIEPGFGDIIESEKIIPYTFKERKKYKNKVQIVHNFCHLKKTKIKMLQIHRNIKLK